MDELLLAARWIHFSTLLIAAGLWLGWAQIAASALRLAGAGEDWHRERAATARLGRGLAAAALLSGLAWMCLQAWTMAGAVTAEALARVLDTQFGTVAALRSGLLLAVLLVPQRHAAAGPLALGAAATLAWSGHAGADSSPLRLHLTADVLHLLAAAAWLGGLVVFVRLLTLARRLPPARASTLASAASRGFAPLGGVAVAVLVLTGLVQSDRLVGSLPALLGSDYGLWLLAKLALVTAMLGLAAANRFRHSPRLAATMPPALRRNAVAETGLGLGVLAVVALLGTMAPGLHVQPWWPLPWRLEALRPVPATPTSFFRPLVAHSAASVADGARLFAARCTPCHAAPPAVPDGAPLGDLYWALRQGPGHPPPPSAAEARDDAASWTVVRFLAVAAARDAAARLQPAAGELGVAAPDFHYADPDGTERMLLEDAAAGGALLVFPGDGEESAARTGQVTERRPWFAEKGLAVVVVPPTAEDGTEVRAAYAQLVPGIAAGLHTELLVDRAGRLRARWHPGDALDWRSARLLAAQLKRIADAAPAPAGAHGAH